MGWSVSLEVRGQPMGVLSLYLLCVSLGVSSGYQAWHKRILFSEPSRLLLFQHCTSPTLFLFLNPGAMCFRTWDMDEIQCIHFLQVCEWLGLNLTGMGQNMIPAAPHWISKVLHPLKGHAVGKGADCMYWHHWLTYINKAISRLVAPTVFTSGDNVLGY